MKRLSVGFLGVVTALIVAACGSGPGSCESGAPCEGNSACCGGNVLFQCYDGTLAQVQMCTNDYVCDANTVTCGGGNVDPTDPCAHGDVCTVGELRCSTNFGWVMRCERPNPSSCAFFVNSFSCSDRNMHCDLSGSGSGDINDCVNGCGGRGFPLYGTECAPDPSLPCGTLICDESGALVGDHTACLAGGFDCTTDTDCASCSCVGGKCVGEAHQCGSAASCK